MSNNQPQQSTNSTSHKSETNSAHLEPTKPSKKLKRFRFNHDYDLYLLQAVSTTGAHIAEWGKNTTKYKDTLILFSKCIPKKVFETNSRPTCKTLRDRIERLINERKKINTKNQNSSGISEEYGELETLLDDIILEKSEVDEKIQEQKQKQKSLEIDLTNAGENIRKKALGDFIQNKLSRDNKSHQKTAKENGR